MWLAQGAGRAIVGTMANPLLSRAGVPSAFDRVAGQYDGLVGANPGYAAHLAESAARLQLAPAEGRVLDVCCGTGISTGALRATYPGATLVGLDGSENMLAVAAQKPDLRATFVHGDGHDPGRLVEGPFDAVFTAYGVRNLSDPDRFLENVFGLIRPGGRLGIHDYCLDGSRRAAVTWNAVSLGIVLPLGVARSRHVALWRYLRRSVFDFDRIEPLRRRVLRAGFREVAIETMTGWQRGIVHTLVATRP